MWDFDIEWGAVSRMVQDLGYHDQKQIIGQLHLLLEAQHTTVKMQPPDINTATKGRPRLGAKLPEKSNKRDPSAFEYAEEECAKVTKRLKAGEAAPKSSKSNTQASGSTNKLEDTRETVNGSGILHPVSSWHVRSA